MHTDPATAHDHRSANGGAVGPIGQVGAARQAPPTEAGHHQHASGQAAEQRRRAQRTAWKLGLLALAVYVGFILTGVIGR